MHASSSTFTKLLGNELRLVICVAQWNKIQILIPKLLGSTQRDTLGRIPTSYHVNDSLLDTKRQGKLTSEGEQ